MAEMLCIMIIVLGWLSWPALIGSLITLPHVNKRQKIMAVRTLGWLGGLGYNSTGNLICTGPFRGRPLPVKNWLQPLFRHISLKHCNFMTNWNYNQIFVLSFSSLFHEEVCILFTLEFWVVVLYEVFIIALFFGIRVEIKSRMTSTMTVQDFSGTIWRDFFFAWWAAITYIVYYQVCSHIIAGKNPWYW